MRDGGAAETAAARIVHCIPNMWAGGAQRQLVYLAREQVIRGRRVCVILTQGGPLLASLEATGAAIERVHGANHSPLLAWRVAQVLSRIRPDLVQTWINQMDVLGGLAARRLSVPWVLCERNSTQNYPSNWKNRLRVLIARGADAIVSNSRGGDAYWLPRLAPSVLRRVIGNAVPAEEIARARPVAAAEAGLKTGEKLVLFAGRLSPEKNFEVLIDALQAAQQSVPFRAVLCGDGTHEAAVREGVRRRGVAEWMLVKGFEPDIWSWMKRADAFVSVSRFEGRPNAVLEAMACGSPVVLSDIPAHREIASEASALFVDSASVDSVAAGVLRCLAEPEAARRRAEAAQILVAGFGASEMACRFEEVYREILEARRRPAPRATQP